MLKSSAIIAGDDYELMYEECDKEKIEKTEIEADTEINKESSDANVDNLVAEENKSTEGKSL